MTENSDKIPRTTVFEAIVTNALAFDRLRITIASSFLGGSLLFMERIAPNPSTWSLWILAIGWLLLVCCIASVAWTQRMELKSGREVLDGDFDHARQIDNMTSALATSGTWTLTFGMALVMLFGLLNVSLRPG